LKYIVFSKKKMTSAELFSKLFSKAELFSKKEKSILMLIIMSKAVYKVEKKTMLLARCRTTLQVNLGTSLEKCMQK